MTHRGGDYDRLPKKNRYICAVCGRPVEGEWPLKRCPSCGRDGRHLRRADRPDPLAKRRKAIKAARERKSKREAPDGATETEGSSTSAEENAGHGSSTATDRENASRLQKGMESTPQEQRGGQSDPPETE
jgi:hypothetical protein